MAKYRKRRKSSKCPEPLNTLIDIAGGLAMGAVANHMEKKYQYKAKGKINPFTVSAYGIASGRMRTTKDVLRTGAMLGAMGSFDVDDTRYSAVLDDPIFYDIPEQKTNNNRYAWRLNCEDGSEYSVSPDDYETRSEYDEALHLAKTGQHRPSSPKPTQRKEVEHTSTHTAKNYIYLRVSRLDNGKNQYFLTENRCIKVGDTVTVPTDNGQSQGVVIAVENYSVENAPQPPEETTMIIE